MTGLREKLLAGIRSRGRGVTGPGEKRLAGDQVAGARVTAAPETAPLVIDVRLLVPAVTAWSAVAAALGQPEPMVALVALGLLASACGLVLAGRRKRLPGWTRLAALTGVATALALTCLAAQSTLRAVGPVRELAAHRATVTVEGTVGTEPKVVPRRAGSRGDTPLVVVRLDADVVTGRGVRSEIHTPVLVLGDASWVGLRWMERVRATGRLAPAEVGDDVVAVLTPGPAPASLAPPGNLGEAADHVRERFRGAASGLPADARGLLPGLVIGDTANTPPELTRAMLDTGMTHLSAVSGSNVAVILAAALGLCRLLGLRRRGRPLVALVILAAFVILVRPEPSVVRAAVMGAVGLLGMSTSRRRAGLPALATAILLLICWDPWLARSYGFALSALATLGLLLFANPWGAVIGRLLPARVRHWGPALAVPVAAQMMCAPVVVLLQGSVTVIGVLANLLAAPLVAPATIAGVATAMVSVVWAALAEPLAWVAAVPTLGIAWVARKFATVPMGTLPWPDGPPGAVLLAVLTLAGVLAGPWLLLHGRRRPLLIISFTVVSLAVAVPTRHLTWPPAHWQMVACDVGQGDALVLSTGPGRALLVDAGPDPAKVDACLSRLGVETLDAVVLTHFHADHTEGLPGVLHGRQVRQILATPVREPAVQWDEVRRWAAEADVPLAELYAGDDLRWGGTTAHVWWPERVVREGSVPNNASVVMSVAVSDLHLVLLGDVERESAHQVLSALRRDGRALGTAVDVVKVAHHGSANRDDELLASLPAPVAVISVGLGNDYGHPAPSTLEALQRQGFQVYRTDRDGDVAVSRDAGGPVLVAVRGP